MTMKTRKIMLALMALMINLVGTKSYAYDIAVQNEDGVTIYYNYINEGRELEVTYKEHNGSYSRYSFYSGSVVIPEEVTIMNETRKVTKIGELAFSYCKNLQSATIPNSVISIENKAF